MDCRWRSGRALAALAHRPRALPHPPRPERIVEGDRWAGRAACRSCVLFRGPRQVGRRRRVRLIKLVDVARAGRDGIDAREDRAGSAGSRSKDTRIGVLRSDIAPALELAEVGRQQDRAVDGDGQAALYRSAQTRRPARAHMTATKHDGDDLPQVKRIDATAITHNELAQRSELPGQRCVLVRGPERQLSTSAESPAPSLADARRQSRTRSTARR